MIRACSLQIHWCIAATICLFACNNNSVDPFASPAIGKKLSIDASLKNSMPLTEETNSARVKWTFLKVDRSSNFGVGVPGRVQGQEDVQVKVSTISLYDKNNVSVKRTMDEFLQRHQSKDCPAGKASIKEVLNTQRGMILICDEPFLDALKLAVKIEIELEDSKKYEFTSWGSHYSDISGGSESIVVHTLAI